MQHYTTLIDTITTQRQLRTLSHPDFDIALRLAYSERGILSVESGDYIAGRADLEAAYGQVELEALLPDDAPAMLALGRAAEALGDYAAAGSAYTTYVRLAGDSADPEIVARVAAFEEGGLTALMSNPPAMIAEFRLGTQNSPFVPFFFSADSRVVGFSEGYYVRLYDTRTGEALAGFDTVNHHEGIAALNEDGSLVIGLGGIRTIEVINTATAEVVFSTRITEAYEPPHALAFDGEDILVLDEGGIFRRLDLASGEFENEVTLSIRFRGIGGTDVIFTPARDTAAVYTSYLGAYRLLEAFDLHSGVVAKLLELEEGHVVAMSDDLEIIVTKQPSEDSVSVMSFTPNGLSEIAILETAQISASGDLDATGAHYIYGDANGQLILIDLATSERTMVGVHDASIRSVGLSPDARIAVAIDVDGYFRIWEISAP